MAYAPDPAERIRRVLAGHEVEVEVEVEVRDVKMFGGLSFVVNEKPAVTANNRTATGADDG